MTTDLEAIKKSIEKMQNKVEKLQKENHKILLSSGDMYRVELNGAMIKGLNDRIEELFLEWDHLSK